jgi:hypothetical protein
LQCKQYNNVSEWKEQIGLTVSFSAFSLPKLHQIAGTISLERTAKGFRFPFPRREMIMITVTHGKMKTALQTEGDMEKLINFSL